jgi:hypothetical protein
VESHKVLALTSCAEGPVLDTTTVYAACWPSSTTLLSSPLTERNGAQEARAKGRTKKTSSKSPGSGSFLKCINKSKGARRI